MDRGEEDAPVDRGEEGAPDDRGVGDGVGRASGAGALGAALADAGETGWAAMGTSGGPAGEASARGREDLSGALSTSGAGAGGRICSEMSARASATGSGALSSVSCPSRWFVSVGAAAGGPTSFRRTTKPLAVTGAAGAFGLR